jgi:hypothetical protein
MGVSSGINRESKIAESREGFKGSFIPPTLMIEIFRVSTEEGE